MTALDVISLDEAKLFLKVDFADDDALITDIIGAAVSLVEQKTQYRLYQRIETQHSDGTYNVDLLQTPLNSVNVVTYDGTPYTACQVKRQPLRTTVIFVFRHRGYNTFGFGDGFDNGTTFYNYPASLPLFTLNIDCGYQDVTQIPATLIQAVKTVISNMYENRDTEYMQLPDNLTMEIESFNQSPLF